MFTKSERTTILERLEKLTESKGYLDKTDFFKIQEIISTKIGLSFETIENDVYQNHLNKGKYVFLKKHSSCSDFFNSGAKTFGSIIEGDNLLVLFLLQNIYKKEKNKVDLIYIDPPYNNESSGFIYNNDYRIKNSDKGLCVVNKEDNFRHSKWLSIMQSRLKYAKKLLKDTGLIAISIDDSELYHLKLLMDEIFGSDCYKGTIVWKTGVGMWSSKNIRKDHEYILIYEKLKEQSQFYFQPEKETKWKKVKLLLGGKKGKWVPNSPLWYPITYQGKEILPYNNKGDKKLWTISKKRFDKENKANKISFEGDKKGNYVPYLTYIKTSPKTYLKSVEEFAKCPICKKLKNSDDSYLKSVEEFVKIYHQDVCPNNDSYYLKSVEKFRSMGSTKLSEDLGKAGVFDYPKTISLMKHLILHMAPKDGIILDFFAGSGTTACAVAELNKDDKDEGKRQFILITNNDGDNVKQIKNQLNANNHLTNPYCVFRDVLYPRLQKNQDKDKYDLSCKVFMIDEYNFQINNQETNETFISQQERYLQTCTNLLAILKPNEQDLDKKEIEKKGYKFRIDDLDYGFFQSDLDINMRFDFELRKQKK